MPIKDLAVSRLIGSVGANSVRRNQPLLSMEVGIMVGSNVGLRVLVGTGDLVGVMIGGSVGIGVHVGGSANGATVAMGSFDVLGTC